jgi:hypothetical protein
MGSYSGPKGVTVLLDALRSLRRSATRWECVMPACLPDAKYASRERPAKRLARALGYRNVGERLLPQFRDAAWSVLRAGDDSGAPPWLGCDEFHSSHRSNLLRKLPEHYSQFGWSEPNDLPYVWPNGTAVAV